MDEDWFIQWKNGVKSLNETSDEVDKGREEAYRLLSDEIKQIFERNGTAVANIHFSSDCSVVTVTFDGNTSKSISFKKSCLEEIAMPFAVKRKLTREATNELYIELYPLEDN